jgi:hypothetical protein
MEKGSIKRRKKEGKLGRKEGRKKERKKGRKRGGEIMNVGRKGEKKDVSKK